MFLFVLNNKYNTIPESVTKRVENATQEELESWLKKILAGNFEMAEIE